MTTHAIGTRDEWRQARLALLAAEKDLTRRSDALALQRQALPWVRIDKRYSFETERGRMTLSDRFAGRSQLMVYHFMFGPEYKAGCPSCSSDRGRIQRHRRSPRQPRHDAVGRVALAAREACGLQQRLGWTFPWASSLGSDFNYDFNVSFVEEQQRGGDVEYNYRREPPMTGTTSEWTLRSDANPVARIAASTGHRRADVHARAPRREHVRARGRHRVSRRIPRLRADWMRCGACTSGSTAAPKGRNESGVWWRRNDEYDEAA
jgi:predicted dithiol-disulfide oxidoreductase (DUF899 family)